MRKFKELIESLGLDYKKEMIINCLLIGVLVIGSFVSFIFLPLMPSIFISLGSCVVIYFKFNTYSKKKLQQLALREEEFVYMMKYLNIFLENKYNIYQCFQSLLPYCSMWMKEKIGELLENIDVDKSVQPYVVFASNFKSNYVKNVLLTLYQMVDEGEDSTRLQHFALLFEEISKTHSESKRTKKKKQFDSLSTFPLIGAGLITVLLTFGIITIIGEMMNVF